ncbi:DUF2271 domain-containing protein [Sphingobacterium hungaricum]|uniref:DUF2271 domain-containing protein n=1 Tax=Sphingobacterium hungaricum TaxID=2082723 RepID=A0A928YS25_9SPHI|nr:DUF2271 domain-containing protein [Sphingobacterium hungaricum]MBE8713848.1 DUF2271 domain-containing protein [Sphingobacterium hungaricum]
MKAFLKIGLLLVVSLFISASSFAQTSKYKCMIQMIGYEGEAAYVIISLINPNGGYEKTLSVLGPDKQWFNTLKEWHKFQLKSKEKLSAITGASVGGGDRAMRTIEIDNSKLNKGYKIRFESAVEEQKYHPIDVDIPLTTEGVTARADGKGYIRFVKLNKVQ